MCGGCGQVNADSWKILLLGVELNGVAGDSVMLTDGNRGEIGTFFLNF